MNTQILLKAEILRSQIVAYCRLAEDPELVEKMSAISLEAIIERALDSRIKWYQRRIKEVHPDHLPSETEATTPDDDVDLFEVVDAMQAEGGGFVISLANAWRHADPDNRQVLRQAFDIYFRQYAGRVRIRKANAAAKEVQS